MEEGRKFGLISKEGLIISGFLAIIFTFFDYFYIFLNKELGLDILGIAQGSSQLIGPKLMELVSDNFAVLPLIVFWVLAGAIAYFFYFSLEVVYYDISLFFKSEKNPPFFWGS